MIRVAGLSVALCLMFTDGAQAAEAAVKVPGTTMPWSLKANPNIPFGRNDGTKPVELKGVPIVGGQSLRITATGTTSTIPGGAFFGPAGQADFVATEQPGGSGTLFPARFIDPTNYPVHLNELVGVFVDEKGALVARPFAIGEEFVVTVPARAKKLQFGLNDDIFADNAGELNVTVQTVE